jgi:hypothetical protein
MLPRYELIVDRKSGPGFVPWTVVKTHLGIARDDGLCSTFAYKIQSEWCTED